MYNSQHEYLGQANPTGSRSPDVSGETCAAHAVGLCLESFAIYNPNPRLDIMYEVGYDGSETCGCR